MKTTKILGIIMLLYAAIMPCTAHAQLYKSTYYNIDWQLNTPVFTDYAKIAVGIYGSFHTNNEYVETQVLQLNSSSNLYTDQVQSIFQIPFGALIKYRFVEDSMFEPYVTAKLGTNYVRMSSINNVLDFYSDSWGFNVQPEVGVSIFPSAHNRIGIHLAMYYSYSTNQNQCLVYNLNGLNNVGFNIGITF